MSDQRPNPEALLARVNAEEPAPSRGRLKIFFGAAPGVGKTYAMLESARKAAKEGTNVLIGYIEPHVRPETQALVLGLDILPRRQIDYRGTRFLEFDLEAALLAHPKLILVDELAHTNAPTMTHAKRWQDVEKLLSEGIHVYATLNVQHLESLNDIIAQITGIVVRETVPDSIFEHADEIELVDLPPDDLIGRLHEGKVYVSGQAERAIENYFKKPNLIALRELALRRTAERVNAQMEVYRTAHAELRTWPTSERLLVSISPSPHAARLVRATRRMAASMRASWIAAHIETARDVRLGKADTERLAETMHLAEELGGETVTISGANLVDGLLDYARYRNVTKIVVGKTQAPRWREWLQGSLVYELTRKCGDIDIYVISGNADEPSPRIDQTGSPKAPMTGYLWAIATVVLCTALGWAMTPRFAPANLIMVYLLGVVAVSVRHGRGPSVLASILSVAAFDVVFVPPQGTFAVSDAQYLLTFGVMLVTGLTISALTTRLKMQAEFAQHRERRTAALYAMSRELIEADTTADLARQASKHVGTAFDSDVFLLFPESGREHRLARNLATSNQVQLDDRDLAVAQWVFENGERAGQGTDTLPSASSLFVPLKTPQRIVGILGIRPHAQPSRPFLSSEQLRLLETFGSQLALAEERIRSASAAQQALLQVEGERLRNSLLSAVSHDLRTPLTTIAGASSMLMDADGLDVSTRRELATSIYEEVERLNRLIANLLDMTRLEASALALKKEWQLVEELFGVVLKQIDRQLHGRNIVTHLATDLPLVPFDMLLIQQVLVNLLENALKYTPTDSQIEIAAKLIDHELQIEVSDRGPGIHRGDEERIFEKFYRAPAAVGRSGVGLGLAICRGIVRLHGGRIWAKNRPGGGAVFAFTLPLGERQPTIRPDRLAVE